VETRASDTKKNTSASLTSRKDRIGHTRWPTYTLLAITSANEINQFDEVT